MTEKKKLKVKIFDKEFSLLVENQEIAAELATYVNKIMDETKEELKDQPTETIAIIAASFLSYLETLCDFRRSSGAADGNTSPILRFPPRRARCAAWRRCARRRWRGPRRWASARRCWGACRTRCGRSWGACCEARARALWKSRFCVLQRCAVEAVSL